MLKKILVVLCLILSPSANAALVDNGTYVTDTIRNIDFLKLSQTQGYSYNQIVVEDTLGLISDGWEVTSQILLVITDSNDASAYSLINDVSIPAIVTNNDSNGGQTSLPGSVYVDLWLGPMEDYYTAYELAGSNRKAVGGESFGFLF